MLIINCSLSIGIETIRAITAIKVKLFLGIRNIRKGEVALRDILKLKRVKIIKINLNSFKSVYCYILLNKLIKRY